TLHPGTVMAGLNSKSSNIANAVNHVHDIVVSGAAPMCAIEDGIYPLHVAEALIRSHEHNGTWERVGSVG
ncbi:MAG: gfo/Idh/MocA family oxidoreductase, partial [Paenibacillus sp.]|nr:gfo/Idh/MocA family oxidoreductase [Paenibacillus sp.]